MDLVIRQKGIILVDFDNTAFIWMHGKDAIERHDDNMSYELICGNRYHEKHGEINIPLMDTLKKEKQNYGIYMLSHCSNIFTYEAKKRVLEEGVPGLFDGYLFTDGPAGKLKLAMDIRRYVEGRFPYPNRKDLRVIMIDDMYEVKQLFLQNGMEFYFPIELMVHRIPS